MNFQGINGEQFILRNLESRGVRIVRVDKFSFLKDLITEKPEGDFSSNFHPQLPLRYLDQLGLASSHNHSVHCRQSLVGGNYGLVSSPIPSFFSFVLWRGYSEVEIREDLGGIEVTEEVSFNFVNLKISVKLWVSF